MNEQKAENLMGEMMFKGIQDNSIEIEELKKMPYTTEEVLANNIGGLLSLIQDNGATISELKKMMDKVVEGMDDLTKRIETLEHIY
jgi:hypothetical protein